MLRINDDGHDSIYVEWDQVEFVHLTFQHPKYTRALVIGLQNITIDVGIGIDVHEFFDAWKARGDCWLNCPFTVVVRAAMKSEGSIVVS